MLDMALRLLGFIALWGAIGALVGLVITPFILYVTYIIAYGLALVISLILRNRTLNKGLMGFQEFVNPVNAVVHNSHNEQAKARHANNIQDDRNSTNDIVDRHIIGQNPMTAKPNSTSCQATNHNAFDMVNQAIVKNALNKLRNVIHWVTSFYRRFYGHSTKVEKNRKEDSYDHGEQSTTTRSPRHGWVPLLSP